MKLIKENERGSILITVLVLVVVSVLIMGAGISYFTMGEKRFYSHARRIQALNLAEAGIDYTTEELFNSEDIEALINSFKGSNPSATPFTQTFQLTGNTTNQTIKGKFITRIWNPDPNHDKEPPIMLEANENILISKGQVLSSSEEPLPYGEKTIYSVIKRPMLASEIFENAVSSKYNVTLGSSSKIKGNIHSGQDSSNYIDVSTSDSVDGSVKTPGNVYDNKNKITGEILENDPGYAINIPSLSEDLINLWRNPDSIDKDGTKFFDEIYYDVSKKFTGGSINWEDKNIYYSGELEITGGTFNLNNSIIYVKKGIKLSGNPTFIGTGIVVVDEGVIKGNKNTALNIAGTLNKDNDKPSIEFINLGTGLTTITGNGVTAAVISLNGEVSLTGSAYVKGVIVGKNVTVQGNATIEHKAVEIPGDPFTSLGPIQITKWIEYF
jgi:Tfp pilus assembly protein PilX/cytoskeletal protein CcmA (bactofilin family)